MDPLDFATTVQATSGVLTVLICVGAVPWAMKITKQLAQIETSIAAQKDINDEVGQLRDRIAQHREDVNNRLADVRQDLNYLLRTVPNTPPSVARPIKRDIP